MDMLDAAAADTVEELWVESVRRFHGERHHQNAQAWYEHHGRQLAALEATFAALAARHRAERDRYGRMLGIGVPEDGGADGPPPEAA